MGRMTWTTNMNQRSKWCPPVNQDVQVVSTASAVGAVSKDGCAVGAVSKWSAQQCCWSSSWDVHNDSQHVSTICSACCHISVHQGWSSWSSWLSDSKWCQTQMPSGVQVGQVSDSRVGSMETKLVSSRSSGFKQMSVMFILVE